MSTQKARRFRRIGAASIASDEPQRFIVPIWVMALGAIAVATAIYVGLSMSLSTQATELSTLVRALPPPERVAVARESQPTEIAAVEPVEFALVPEFEKAIPDNLRRLLNGTESVSLARLIIQGTNPEVFLPSRAELSDGYAAAHRRAGQGDRRQ